MAKGFKLSHYPVVYLNNYLEDSGWQQGDYRELFHLTAADEARLDEKSMNRLIQHRNNLADIPLISYTTQYGLGCFEGLKAFPHADGDLYLFRPDANAARMARSMQGLYMPPYPAEMFVENCRQVISRNQRLNFTVNHNPDWRKDDFADGESIYLRPFTMAEGGVGVSISQAPWIVFAATPVGAFFNGMVRAVITERIRATENGTGWIKCDANYVTSALAKHEAKRAGYAEAVFLDGKHRRFVEEGSACNVFFYLNNKTLVTPEVESGTILAGITRDSIIRLAQDNGVSVEQRQISIDEAMGESNEVFFTGTAAALTPVESFTYNGSEKKFGKGRTGELTRTLREQLKGIQYGSMEDRHNWLVKV